MQLWGYQLFGYQQQACKDQDFKEIYFLYDNVRGDQSAWSDHVSCHVSGCSRVPGTLTALRVNGVILSASFSKARQKGQVTRPENGQYNQSSRRSLGLPLVHTSNTTYSEKQKVASDQATSRQVQIHHTAELLQHIISYSMLDKFDELYQYSQAITSENSEQ